MFLLSDGFPGVLSFPGFLGFLDGSSFFSFRGVLLFLGYPSVLCALARFLDPQDSHSVLGVDNKHKKFKNTLETNGALLAFIRNQGGGVKSIDSQCDVSLFFITPSACADLFAVH